jgi:hypothetical protein
MKTTRIDVEGPNGEATITRDGQDIRIEGRRLVKAIETKADKTCLQHEGFQLIADARDHEHQMKVARILQSTLDGYRGTNGDVADYARVIQMLAD